MAAAASEPDRCGYAMSSFRFIVDSVWRVFEFLTRKTDIVDGTCVSDKLTEKPPDEGNMSQLCSRFVSLALYFKFLLFYSEFGYYSRNTPWIVEARDTTITERRMTRSTVKPSLMMVKSNDKANKKAAIRQSTFFWHEIPTFINLILVTHPMVHLLSRFQQRLNILSLSTTIASTFQS